MKLHKRQKCRKKWLICLAIIIYQQFVLHFLAIRLSKACCFNEFPIIYYFTHCVFREEVNYIHDGSARHSASPRETSTVSGPQNALFPLGPVKCFIIYQSSKKRQNKAELYLKLNIHR